MNIQNITKQLLKRGTAMFILLLLCAAANAIHIKGGWIFYTYLGTVGANDHRYKVTVKVYRDCAPPNPGQNDSQINVSIFGAGGTFLQNANAVLTSSYRLQKTTYSECINPQPEVCYVILEYETEVILPASEEGYTLSFQRCCRINNIINIIQPSNTYGNTYSITIPGNRVNATNVVNSSPVFSQRDTLLVCYSSAITLDYGAIDPDNDSLVYYFTDAFSGADQSNPNPTQSRPPPYSSLPYATGFSPSDPFGTNVQINRSTGLISGISPANTGEYVVAVAVDEYRNGVRIASTRKELHVNVANCSIAAAKLPIRIMSCDGFTVQFENQSPSPAILNYYWDFGVKGAINDTSVNAVPQFTYPDTGIYIAKLVVNRGSTCSDSALTEVRVYPGFFPGFKVDGACFLNPFSFTDTSRTRYGVINSWKWNFGDPAVTSDTSRFRNPPYKYPTPGAYTASLEVSSDKGCSDTIFAVVNVLDRPLLTLGFRDTLICSIDSLQLKATGSSGTFLWRSSPTLINPASPNPIVFPKDTTFYYVTLTDRGCIATDSVKVNVLDFITVDAGPDTTICRTDGVQMKPITQALSFSWLPAALFDNSRNKNAIATPTAATTTLYLNANLGKCQARDSLVVKTVPYPVANAGNDSVICYNDTVFLRGTAVGSTYAWTPSTLVANPNQLFTQAVLLQTTTFTLTVRDNLGCPKPVTDAVTITVRPKITVFAGNDTTVVIGQRLQFNGNSNATLFAWSPGTALSSTTILNPTAVYTSGSIPLGQDAIKYVLTASTPEGCNAFDDIIVRIFKTGPSIFVPNGFTPNSDGLNDVIRPVLAGMQRLDFFRVYNRYGQLVFETNQINKGWDGRVNGNPQASNAFVFQCQALDFEGKTVTKKGTFVLVR